MRNRTQVTLFTAFALLVASPALSYELSSVGTLGVAGDISAGTTLAVTTTAALEAGNVAVCSVAKDETGTGTTDGSGNGEFTSAADDAGNLWNEAYEYCNMQDASPATGACTAVYYTHATDTLASGADITFTFPTATASAATCWEFSADQGSLLKVAAAEGQAVDAADPAAMVLATGTSRSYLFVRGTGVEALDETWTPSATFTGFTAVGATGDTGVAGTSMGARAEFKIETAATSTSSDPTAVGVDNASVMVGFYLAGSTPRGVRSSSIELFHGLVNESTDLDGALCATNEILVDIGATWECKPWLPDTQLWEFHGQVDATPECLYPVGGNLSSAGSAPCTNSSQVQSYAPRSAVITELTTEVLVAGDAGYDCTLDILVGDTTAIGNSQVVPANSAVGAVIRTAQSVAISEGDEIHVRASTTTTACEGTADPRFIVRIFGYWTD